MAISDPDTLSAEALARGFGIPKVVTDYQEIVDDPSVDVVDVCVPRFLHYPIVMAALNQGKHVMCEKPIAMNTASSWATCC